MRKYPKTPLTNLQQRVVVLYKAGLKTTDIEAQTGVNRGSVSWILGKAGVPARRKRDYIPNLNEKDVVDRYVERGESPFIICRELGLSEGLVRGILKANGVMRRAGNPGGLRRSSPTYETEFKRARPCARERAEGRCEVIVSPTCSGQGTHVHHRKIRSQGGTNDLSNLLVVCHPCHKFIHDHPEMSYEKGWLVRSSNRLPSSTAGMDHAGP
jgi:hypothetical protein